ncbi:MAG: hypothetical protein IJ571_00160 [Ruminococcus sp.]|nr:hypothetical protein [Ruminococcus sp.]
MNINNIYYEQLTDMDSYCEVLSVYKSFPKLDDSEIEPLLKSQDEVDKFIEEQNAIPNREGYSFDALEAFMGDEFIKETRQPQHLLLSHEECIKARLHRYYSDIADAWREYGSCPDVEFNYMDYRYIHTLRELPTARYGDEQYQGSLLALYRERYLNWVRAYRRELSMYGMM